MCGVIAAFSKSTNKKKKAPEVNQFIIEQFEEQHNRGTRGFGIIRIAKNMSIEIDRACETSKFLLDLYMNKASMIIAHHRTPTSTDNKLDQTHPIYVSNKILEHDYLVVHNGIISNDNELYKKHEELGFLYTTEYLETSIYHETNIKKFNDSEALAIELALFIEKKISAIGVENNAAFIILQLNKTTNKATKVLFGKNETGELNIQQENNSILLSSEGPGTEVEANKLFSFNPNDTTLTLESIAIPFKKKEIKALPSAGYHYGGHGHSYGYQTQTTEVTPKKEEHTNAISEKKEDPTKNLIPIVDKGYIGNTCVEFKEAIKAIGTTELSHCIDDTLDTMTETIAEILDEYKTLLLTEEQPNEIEDFYADQIKRTMRTMRAVANIAAREYGEKFLIEDQIEQDGIEADKALGIDQSKKPKTLDSAYKTKHQRGLEWEEQHYGPRNDGYGNAKINF